MKNSNARVFTVIAVPFAVPTMFVRKYKAPAVPESSKPPVHPVVAVVSSAEAAAEAMEDDLVFSCQFTIFS
ncbi:hypothetical protein [Siphonobacter sp. SORGH_AS_0500]|uniref:hypothetical protein n=1 Tax=Siphonobacter sp. SORGH_AS_0500 TaxID=1864824 RepID=UPI00350FECE6